jgi:hypothetical protein
VAYFTVSLLSISVFLGGSVKTMINFSHCVRSSGRNSKPESPRYEVVALVDTQRRFAYGRRSDDNINVGFRDRKL